MNRGPEPATCILDEWGPYAHRPRCEAHVVWKHQGKPVVCTSHCTIPAVIPDDGIVWLCDQHRLPTDWREQVARERRVP